MATSPWTCTQCSALNASTVATCVSCGQARAPGAAPATTGDASGASSSEPAGEHPGSDTDAATPAPGAGWQAPTPRPEAEWPAPAATAGPGAGWPAALASPPATGAWQPSGATPPPGPAATRSRIPGVARALVSVVVIAVVALGAWWFSAKRDDGGAITDAGDLSSLELREGDCFDLKDASDELVGDVDAKPCGETHEYEVYLVQDVPDGGFPGAAAFDTYVADTCLPAFAEYVGLAYEESELEIYYLVPSEDSWGEGDRAVMCAVYHPRIDELTGSLKGHGR